LGFRGEALAAIVSLADKVEIASKREEDTVGAKLTVEKGEHKETKALPMRRGTSLAAWGLFKRLPVRRKVQEKDGRKREELRKLETILTAYSLIKPGISMSFHHNQKLMFRKTPKSDPLMALAESMDGDVAAMMRPLRVQVDESVSLNAWIPCKPTGPEWKARMTRATMERTILSVNGRPVQDKTILAVLRKVFTELVQQTRYPVAIVAMDVPPASLDVNLEPSKKAVLFEGQRDVIEALDQKLRAFYGLIEEEQKVQDDSLINESLIPASEKNDTSLESNLNESTNSEEAFAVNPNKRKVLPSHADEPLTKKSKQLYLEDWSKGHGFDVEPVRIYQRKQVVQCSNASRMDDFLQKVKEKKRSTVSKGERRSRKGQNVTFRMSCLTLSNEPEWNGPECGLIGRVEGEKPFWLCLWKGKLALINHEKGEEALIYRRLLENQVLQSVRLAEPVKVPLNAKIDSNLLKKNGFEVEGECMVAHPKRMTISQAMTDLQELAQGPGERPRNVRSTLAAEARRMAVECAPMVDEEKALAMLTEAEREHEVIHIL